MKTITVKCNESKIRDVMVGRIIFKRVMSVSTLPRAKSTTYDTHFSSHKNLMVSEWTGMILAP
jgi:hypothetical protein